MRLLTWNSNKNLDITRDLSESIPPYAILSHTWGPVEEEVTLNDIQSASGSTKYGYTKIKFCRQKAELDGLRHFWVDTCCIDRSNHVELSEAITSMFRWYQNAKICYVYLSDVSAGLISHFSTPTQLPARDTWEVSFRRSRWFTRGWTLQELLAPKHVVFFSKEGRILGDKHVLEDLLHSITKIPTSALRGNDLSQFSTEERLRWCKGRMTKKPEDQAYCLLGIFGVYMPLIYGEGDHAFVRLTEEINKTPKVTFPLTIVEGAMFDAYDQGHQGCHPDTRVELLQSIRSWAEDSNGESIFWLNGMAGTGKSTVSFTIAKWVADVGSGGPAALGASFFFKRGDGDRASATLLFPTISYQLAHQINGFDVFLAQAVKANPQICSKALGEQFKKLILEPLRQLDNGTSHLTYVVVVDALDECNNEDDIRTVLQLWSTFPTSSSIRLRLFLTSRPELVIRLGFKKMPTSSHQDIVLHDIAGPIIQHDISVFLTDALAKIRDEYNLEPLGKPLVDGWPGSDLLQQLTDMAVPLFIVAATIERFIHDAENPQHALDAILQSRVTGNLSNIGQIYASVLQAITKTTRYDHHEENVHSEFRTIVGAIVCLAEPLSRKVLAALLEFSSESVQLRLRSLHAVLHVPNNEDDLIRPLHLSFGEYLTSSELKDKHFAIDAMLTHDMLWRRCLRILSDDGGLRDDICGVTHPGTLKTEVPVSVINQGVQPVIRYACRYWVYHVKRGTHMLSDDDEIHAFLQRYFLNWLEALSWVGRLADTIALVSDLQLKTATENSDGVVAFLQDARRFILSSRFISEQAPLQLYSSAICFAPLNSVIKSSRGLAPKWVLRIPLVPPTWGADLKKLEGHTRSVEAIAFSPDSMLLASGSADGTVRLWNTRTGQKIGLLKGHNHLINALVFSPDSKLLAANAIDTTIRIWNITGQEIQQLSYDMPWVNTLAFSPDGTLLASGSVNGTFRLWDINTGQELRQLTGHKYRSRAIAFSNDGKILASAFGDDTVRLWNATTGREIKRIENDGLVNKLRFTADCSALATNRGYLPTGIVQSARAVSAPTEEGDTTIRGSWVEYRGQRVLWLPQEFRNGVSAVHGDTVCIGRQDGNVSFLAVRYP